MSHGLAKQPMTIVFDFEGKTFCSSINIFDIMEVSEAI